MTYFGTNDRNARCCDVKKFFDRYSAVAQLVEQLTVNQRATGSSPVCGAKKERGVEMSDKTYNVVGIGNAIVDLVAHVDDDFLNKYNLPKGNMRLIDANEADNLHKAIDVVDKVSGGSAANTIAGLASLNNPVSFIGKIQDDDFGNAFENGMKKEGADCHTNKISEGISTGRCVVLVTPDAQRTMNTYLGVAASLGPKDINESVVSKAHVTYLEGYLWDKPPAKEAYLKAVDIAHASNGKVALSLSDPFCVDRHRSHFMDLIKNHIDILFSNEDEIKHLFEEDSLDSAINNLKNMNIVCAVTRAEKGSIIVSDKNTYEISAEKVARVVDTTGAGDLYASGFMHGFTNKKDLKTCGHMGSIAAAEIVSHFGARTEKSLTSLFNEKGL